MREVLSAGLEARLYGRQGCPPLQFKLDKFFGSAWLGAMKIPEFKSSRNYFDEIKLSCLVAKVPNSSLPKAAVRHIEVYKKDPVCRIYLRGLKPKEISAWQNEILERLLEKEELPVALEQGLKEYETSEAWAGYEKDVDEELYADIQCYGIVPHLTVSAIVIDEVRQEVLIAAETEWDGHLDEHGITVFLKDGAWRFGHGDCQHDYSSAISSELEDQRVEKICPKPLPSETVETDVSFLFGTWEYDGKTARTLLPQLNFSKQDVERHINDYKKYTVKISPADFEAQEFDHDTETMCSLGKSTFLKAVRFGHKVTLHLSNPKKGRSWTSGYFYKDGVLFDLSGAVLRKI